MQPRNFEEKDVQLLVKMAARSGLQSQTMRYRPRVRVLLRYQRLPLGNRYRIRNGSVAQGWGLNLA